MFEVRLHGRGGQGVVTAAEMLSVAGFAEGHWTQAIPSFGSERMGAPVVAFCRLHDREVRAREPITNPDALVILDPTLLHQVKVFEGLSPSGYVLINSTRTPDELGIAEGLATLPAGRVATTPAVGEQPGNSMKQGKNVPLIAMAHAIPYVATASVADLRDLENKVEKSFDIRGARYIQVHVPCPLGWGCDTGDTIKVARLAAESGLLPIFEAEWGEVTGRRPIRRPVPVDEYLKLQSRFAHLFKTEAGLARVAEIQQIADRNIRRFGLVQEGVPA